MAIQMMPDVDPERYPVARWAAQAVKYREYWDHFSGEWLEETLPGSTAPRYPLKFNPFQMACFLHAALLFGEAPNSPSTLVRTVFEPFKDERRSIADRMTDFVGMVWEENGGRAIQQEGAILSQVFGGIVYGVMFDPARAREGLISVRIDLVSPEHFYPVWFHNQYRTLAEAIISYGVNGYQAMLLGVDAVSGGMYQERWTPDAYEVTVDGKPARLGSYPLQGRNPIGLVPYTYIPHIRVGDFYGISLLDGKLGLAREINDRMADVGDAVSAAARQLPAIKGVNRPTIRDIGGGHIYLDLGQAAPGLPEPEVIYPTGSTYQASQPAVQWATKLLETARIEVYTPPVCYGIDEGSQRSALTLALRMLPAIEHIQQERSFWGDGMANIARQIVRLGIQKGILDVPQDALSGMRVWTEWAPILPRDAEQEINDIVILLNAGLMSPETALERLGTVRDVQTEMNLIKEWLEYQAGLSRQRQDPFEGTGSGGELAGLQRPATPQPELQLEG